MEKRVVRGLLLLVAVGVISGCSTFNRDWKRLAENPASSQGIEGRWEGTWNSEANRHTGELRCIVSKKDDNIYLARFHARFKVLFKLSAGYTVPLKVEARDGRYDFEGEANLHWYAGGIYHYKGTATPTNFHSTYRSKSDHGTFDMNRP